MKRCAIICTGPSLDSVNWQFMPSDRIAVNYAAYVTPDCKYVAILDNNLISNNPDLFWNRTLVTSNRTENMRRSTNCNLPTNRLIINDVLYSIHCAVKFMIGLGFDHITFVGMDGGGKRALCVKEYYGIEDEEKCGNNNHIHHETIMWELIKHKVAYKMLR